ncbi:MAG: TRAP transporter small permease subunit [Firmicutes bacterium]|nr:TRAP transporter small permease subunit [Bacillota bacterium]
MGTLKRIEDGLTKVLSLLITAAMMLLVLIVCVQVVARNLIHFDLGAATDIPVYMMIYTVFLGNILISKQRKNITVDVLKVFVHNRTILAVVQLINDVLCAAALAYFDYYSFRHCLITLRNRGVKISGLNYPEWLMKMIVPVGLTIVCIYFVSYVVKDIQALKDVKEEK